MRMDPVTNRPYFVDHQNKISSFDDPRISGQPTTPPGTPSFGQRTSVGWDQPGLRNSVGWDQPPLSQVKSAITSSPPTIREVETMPQSITPAEKEASNPLPQPTELLPLLPNQLHQQILLQI